MITKISSPTCRRIGATFLYVSFICATIWFAIRSDGENHLLSAFTMTAPGSDNATAPAASPSRMAPVLPSAVLYPAMVERVQSEPEDKTLVWVDKTPHLQTSFYVADPGRPNGIVEYVCNQSDGEKAVTEVFHHVLRATGCDGLVLDIGANTGFYSMLALSEGCSDVFCFDPQPSCVRHITHALVKNGFEGGSVIPNFVGAVGGQVIEVDTSGDCDGRWPIAEMEARETGGAGSRPKNQTRIKTVTLSQVVPADAHIVHAKVDTEGAEYVVLQSMLPLLHQGRIESVIFEMTPMWWAKRGASDKAAVIDLFLALVTKYDFNCRPLDKAPWASNPLYTKDNVGSLATKISETYQTDFWFCKGQLCHDAELLREHK